MLKQFTLLLILGIIIMMFSCKKAPIILSVQQRLDAGKESPLEIIEAGIPIDSLYGKNYEGGLIFYLDVNSEFTDFEGMVAAPEDQSNEAQWGCYTIFTAAERYEIGTGLQNTLDILAECDQEDIAAQICIELELNGKDDWFLPSQDELVAMFENLDQKGLGNFLPDYYWSSSEVGFNLSAYALEFGRDYPLPKIYFKEGEENVRAVRTF